MANGLILRSNTVTPVECLHYALNLPTSVVITGMDSIENSRPGAGSRAHVSPDARSTGRRLTGENGECGTAR